MGDGRNATWGTILVIAVAAVILKFLFSQGKK